MAGLKMKYFVLKPHGDTPYAYASRVAIQAYANYIEDENPELAEELRIWVMSENILKLKNSRESIAEKVHDAWWEEKKKQGFHAPIDCMSQGAHDARAQDYKSYGHNIFPTFHKFCDKCHPDMYPYHDLPERVKDYDRATVDAVLSAMKSTK